MTTTSHQPPVTAYTWGKPIDWVADVPFPEVETARIVKTPKGYVVTINNKKYFASHIENDEK